MYVVLSGNGSTLPLPTSYGATFPSRWTTSAPVAPTGGSAIASMAPAPIAPFAPVAPAPEGAIASTIKPLIPLGQFRDTFIIAIDDEGICIVDQHVAHERVLFERVMERLTSGTLESQRMLVPMVLAKRLKAWWYATIATVGSVIGGAFGYAIGYFFFEAVGEPILKFYGKAEGFAEFAKLFNDYGVAILIIKGMTPFPYKVLTIMAGVTHMPLVPFILASIVARSMRFYLVAGLLYAFGEPIRDFIERRLSLVTTAFVVLLIGGFVAIRLFF